MAENQFELIKRELNQSSPAQGQILTLLLSELSPAQVEGLRLKAAEGKMALELEQLQRLHQFQAASAEVSQFIESVRQLEYAQKGNFSTYKASGTFKTASGTTTVAASKGRCFVATAIYADASHPNVVILRKFRDNVLEKNCIGVRFNQFYYKVGPRLAVSPLTRGKVGAALRGILNAFCNVLRRF